MSSNSKNTSKLLCIDETAWNLFRRVSIQPIYIGHAIVDTKVCDHCDCEKVNAKNNSAFIAYFVETS